MLHVSSYKPSHSCSKVAPCLHALLCNMLREKRVSWHIKGFCKGIPGWKEILVKRSISGTSLWCWLNVQKLNVFMSLKSCICYRELTLCLICEASACGTVRLRALQLYARILCTIAGSKYLLASFQTYFEQKVDKLVWVKF